MQLEFDAVGGAYANALVEIAQENNSLDDVHADVDALQALFSENEQIKNFLFNPVMTPEKKRDVVKNISKEAGLSKYTTNFLNLLIDKDRIEAIEEILEAFEQTYCKMTDTQVSHTSAPVSISGQSLHARICFSHTGQSLVCIPVCCQANNLLCDMHGSLMQVATLRSAVKLEQEQQFLIAKKLQELTGSKNIKLKPIIDDTLIAGFTVSYGSAQIDMSVKGQLEMITNELEGKNVGMLAA